MHARSIDPGILAAVRELEVRARPAVREGLGGRWTSAVRGPGVEFAEVREYVAGDDARILDWNVSARTGRLHVKRFAEEREQTIYWLVDGSRSCQVETAGRSWREAAAETLALVGLAAAQAGDRIGAAFFTEGIDRVIAPRHGTTALLALLARWHEHVPARKGTSLETALREFLRLRTRPSLALLLTDLHDRVSDAVWRAAARRHDLVVLALRPAWFCELPQRGALRLEDPETGRRFLVDLGDSRVRAELARRLTAERRDVARQIERAGGECVELFTSKPLLPPLLSWARRRALVSAS